MMRASVGLFVLCSAFAFLSCSDRPSNATVDATQTMQPWLSALNADDDTFALPARGQFPKDLGLHPSARAESFTLRAVFSPVDVPGTPGSAIRTGILTRMDRVALRSDESAAHTGSAWRYDGLMRSSVFIDSTVAPTDNTPGFNATTGKTESIIEEKLTRLSQLPYRQTVQRMALDLAGAGAGSMWVGADRLTIELANQDSAKCARTYRWQVVLSPIDRVILELPVELCPKARTLGEIAGWQQASTALRGALVTRPGEDEESVTPIAGAAWLSQGWGNLPASGGAVVIDTLQLRLDDGRWLDVTRSKRRSGRGPRTIDASVYADGSEPENITLTWEDSIKGSVSPSGYTYPASINLHSIDHGLDLRVSIMNRLSETSGFGESQLQVPVVLAGSHSGSGFLTFNIVQQ